MAKADIRFYNTSASNKKVGWSYQYSHQMFLEDRIYFGRKPERWENRRRPSSP